MEIFIVSFLVFALILILKKVSERIKINENIEKHALTIEQTTQIYTEELLRRQKILEEMETFLSKAVYLQPFAMLGGEKIFKYILTETKLYEFEDFMSEKNQRVGLNDDLLCFKKCMYKRVNQIDKLIEILGEMEQGKIKGEKKLNWDLKMYLNVGGNEVSRSSS